jgi:hypothetical protein
VAFVVFGTIFYDSGLGHSLTSSGTLNTLGDWVNEGGTSVPPADSYTPATLSLLTAAFDDMQVQGGWELQFYYPFVPV